MTGGSFRSASGCRPGSARGRGSPRNKAGAWSRATNSATGRAAAGMDRQRSGRVRHRPRAPTAERAPARRAVRRLLPQRPAVAVPTPCGRYRARSRTRRRRAPRSGPAPLARRRRSRATARCPAFGRSPGGAPSRDRKRCRWAAGALRGRPLSITGTDLRARPSISVAHQAEHHGRRSGASCVAV